MPAVDEICELVFLGDAPRLEFSPECDADELVSVDEEAGLTREEEAADEQIEWC